VETRGQQWQELLQNCIMYKAHGLYELFTGLTVSQQRYMYLYLSFQINDESKCTKKSYQIFLTFNSHVHMYSTITQMSTGKGSKGLQLFRERLLEKMCTRQSQKVVWDQYTVPNYCSC